MLGEDIADRFDRCGHAFAGAAREAAKRSPDEIIVVCLSGRGDKDAAEIARLRGLTADGGTA